MNQDDDEDLQWFQADNHSARKLPLHLRLAAIDAEGNTYAPAAASGNEELALMCAAFDDEPVAVYEDHSYLRTEWLRAEYPDLDEAMTKVEQLLRQHRKQQ
jgi:hypothetical protein